MKSNLFIAATLLLAASLTGCSDENSADLKSEDFSVKASMGIQSRTTLNGDGTTTVWSEGDQLYLFGGNSNATMTLVSGAGQRNATFRGPVNGYPSELTKALYPVPVKNGDAFTYEFPAEITYSKNSNAPMLGTRSNSDGQIYFSYLTPLVRISLTDLNSNQVNVLKLKMTGITGNATVNLEDGKLEFSDDAARGSEVTVTIPEDITQCYVDIPVPAGTYDGYEVKLNNTTLKSSNDTRELGVNDAVVIGEEVLTEYIAFSTNILGSDEALEVDYAVLGSDGLGYFYNYQDDNPQLPERMTVWDGTQEEIPDESANLVVNFDEQGYPVNIVHPDFTVVLDNHSGSTFDAFVTTTDGESAIFEDVELQDDMTWDEYLQELEQPASRAGFTPSIGTVNRVVGFIGCAISMSADISTSNTGIANVVRWGLTSISCRSNIFSMANNMNWVNNSEQLSNSVNVIFNVTAITNCITPDDATGLTTCFTDVITTVVIIVEEIVNDRQDDIQLGNGALVSGNGAVKITLTWDKPSDIDLHCVDPSGYHIYYADRYSSGTNGYLDFDNIPGFPTCTDPENIYFEAPAPSGRYEIYLHYFSDSHSSGPVNYNVLIMINGVGKTYQGVISNVGDVVPIETFVIGGDEPETRTTGMFRPITWDWTKLPAKD